MRDEQGLGQEAGEGRTAHYNGSYVSNVFNAIPTIPLQPLP
jgi:hypothetical protein